MALKTSTIETVQECVNRIDVYSKQAIEQSVESFNYVLGNQDFVDFMTGTTFGAKAESDLRTLIDIISNKLLPQVSNLCAQTNSFLETQRSLNNNG